MRCSESERSDAILGRPIVINPLHRLPRKLTPVRTTMMRVMRSCFKIPSSTSTDSCSELLGTDFVPSGALGLARAGRDTERDFRGGVGQESFLLGAINSMADSISDMMTL